LVGELGERSWFGTGRRVIITTRDEHLLNELELDMRLESWIDMPPRAPHPSSTRFF
jgi:hypothetical protein